MEKWKSIRDILSFLLGGAILTNEAFFSNPPLDRPGVIMAAVALMGFAIGRWNGKNGHDS